MSKINTWFWKQFSEQQTIIDQLKTEKETAEKQSLHCDYQLSNKRSQLYRLESENSRLESFEERCKSDLRDQKVSLTSIEGRYNLLINSEFYFSWNGCLSFSSLVSKSECCFWWDNVQGMDRRKFIWILSSFWILQRATSIQG